MKNKTLYKIGVFFSEFEGIILRYLFILNTLMFLMFFLPFTSIGTLKGDSYNLFESIGKFSFLISNLNWYSFFSILFYPLLLIQPFLFAFAVAIIYIKDEKHTKSFLVNAFLSEAERRNKQDEDNIKDNSNFTFGIPLYIFSFQILFYLAVAIAFGLWFISFFYYRVNDINETVLPNACILISSIMIIMIMLRLRKSFLRKYNNKLILQLGIELSSDIVIENISSEIINSNLYKNLESFSNAFADFLEKAFVIQQKIQFIIEQPDYLKPILIKNFNVIEQAFPEFFIFRDFWQKKELTIYPLSIEYQGKKIEKHMAIESGLLKINDNVSKTFKLTGRMIDEIKIEFFSTSDWLIYQKNITNNKTFELKFDSQKTNYLKSGQREFGSLHIIQYDDSNNIYTQKFATNIQIEPNFKSVERYSNFIGVITILGFFFWYYSGFPVFLSYEKPMNYNGNYLLVISFCAIYLLSFNLAYHGSKKYFSKNPTSILKSILFGILISFGATALNTYTKSKYGFFLQDLPSGFVKSKGKVNIREATSENSNIMYQAKSGENLKIEAMEGNWYKVYYGLDFQSFGYIRSDYLSIDSTKNIKTNVEVK